jgi:hypothetical protein
MSALPPKADIAERNWDVRFVPKADVSKRSKAEAIRSPRRRARAGRNGEAERPRGPELDEEIEFRRLHHREVDSLLALEDAIYYQPSSTIVLS